MASVHLSPDASVFTIVVDDDETETKTIRPVTQTEARDTSVPVAIDR